MSEGIVGVRVGRRRSRLEASQLVQEYERSGLGRRAFCATRGVAVATLDLYRKRERESVAGGRLVAVELRSPASVDQSTCRSSLLTVVLCNGRRIEMGGALDAELLEQVIVVLERV